MAANALGLLEAVDDGQAPGAESYREETGGTRHGELGVGSWSILKLRRGEIKVVPDSRLPLVSCHGCSLQNMHGTGTRMGWLGWPEPTPWRSSLFPPSLASLDGPFPNQTVLEILRRAGRGRLYRSRSSHALLLGLKVWAGMGNAGHVRGRTHIQVESRSGPCD